MCCMEIMGEDVQSMKEEDFRILYIVHFSEGVERSKQRRLPFGLETFDC